MKIIILAASLLAGCGSLGMNQMSAEQINAAAKSRDASVFCAHATGLWGEATTTVLNIDQKVIDAGSLSVNTQCHTVFTNRRSQ